MEEGKQLSRRSVHKRAAFGRSASVSRVAKASISLPQDEMGVHFTALLGRVIGAIRDGRSMEDNAPIASHFLLSCRLLGRRVSVGVRESGRQSMCMRSQM